MYVINTAYHNYTSVSIEEIYEWLMLPNLCLVASSFILNSITIFILIMSQNMNTKFFQWLKIYILNIIILNINDLVLYSFYINQNVTVYKQSSSKDNLFTSFKYTFYFFYIYKIIYKCSLYFGSILFITSQNNIRQTNKYTIFFT